MDDLSATDTTEATTSSIKTLPSNKSKRLARLAQAGKVRMGALLWALGLPIPLVLLFVLIRGCA